MALHNHVCGSVGRLIDRQSQRRNFRWSRVGIIVIWIGYVITVARLTVVPRYSVATRLLWLWIRNVPVAQQQRLDDIGTAKPKWKRERNVGDGKIDRADDRSNQRRTAIPFIQRKRSKIRIIFRISGSIVGSDLQCQQIDVEERVKD